MTDYKRRVDTCAPDHVCGDEEIQAIITEFRQVDNDPSITVYSSPATIEEMKEVILKASTYDGEWYHSNIVVDTSKLLSDEAQKLATEVIELGSEHGIFYATTDSSFDYSELEAALKAPFRTRETDPKKDE